MKEGGVGELDIPTRLVSKELHVSGAASQAILIHSVVDGQGNVPRREEVEQVLEIAGQELDLRFTELEQVVVDVVQIVSDIPDVETVESRHHQDDGEERQHVSHPGYPGNRAPQQAGCEEDQM